MNKIITALLLMFFTFFAVLFAYSIIVLTDKWAIILSVICLITQLNAILALIFSEWARINYVP